MKTLRPIETEALLKNESTIALDVRTPIEFSEKHIAGSQHLPVDDLEGKVGHLDPNRTYLLVCQSGKRAERAHRILSEQGFENLHILEGGVAAWEQAGLALNRRDRGGLPLMRQVQLIIGLGVLAFSLLAYFVNPAFAFGSAFFGAGLTMAGSTGWCGLAILLSKMPWNRVDGEAASCQSCTL